MAVRMRIAGRMQVILSPGYEPERTPAHVDVLAGAQNPSQRIDGGNIDHALGRGGPFRASIVYASRRSLLRTGEQQSGYADDEHALGLSRALRIQIRDTERTDDVIAALRDLGNVQTVRPESVACTHVPVDACHAAVPAMREAKRRPDLSREIVRAAEALDIEPGDERVTVAVVDSGVSLGHKELRRKLLAGYDTVDIGGGRIDGLEIVGDSRGVDFNPRDEVGHGTHVAGIIAAQGFEVPRGLAGLSLAIPLRVLAAAVAGAGSRRIGVGALSDIDCGLKVACDLGAKIFNLSFGTPETSLGENVVPPHAEVVAYATRAGCILVAAAGNSGKSESFYPAAHPDVIAVGSVGNDLAPSPFSTRGRHVTLAAPGERILSLGIHGARLSTGTSHAAPFVAGAAALLVARGRRAGRDLTARDVKRILAGSARRVQADSETVGAGVLDAAAALRMLEREIHA
jgi:subtilisin family serine protease